MRRSASIARLWTMPSAAPQREERLLHDVLSQAARADHPVGEAVGGSAVPVVHERERSRVGAAHEQHELLVGHAAELGVRLVGS